MSRPDVPPLRFSSTLAVRLFGAAVLAGLVVLAVVALASQRGVIGKARAAHTANQLARVYEDARFWVSQNESYERKYRVEPSNEALAGHEAAGRSLVADLRRIGALDPSASTQRLVARMLLDHEGYERATTQMFAATDAGNLAQVRYDDHRLTDPVFTKIERAVYGGAAAASVQARTQDGELASAESGAFRAGLISIFLAVLLVVLMSRLVRRYRMAGRRMRRAELARLSALVIADPLTELRNHRAFHEDIGRRLRDVASEGAPLALVLLDVDELKAVNDAYGHQAGDELLRDLGRAIEVTSLAPADVYRIGGDEFAVILPGASAWEGLRFAQDLQALLKLREGLPLAVTAGVAEALQTRDKDELIGEADQALISAKRSGEAVSLYTVDMRLRERSAALEEDEHHIRTLAGALALAVDAKDPYTQSHSQTVANLSAAIGTELGLEPERVSRLRIAGLLHDVGKIGIPDAILRKPGKLTPIEFDEMKTHAVLGESIVMAADMPEQAGWVRHHHERIDGSGYPDRLMGDEIPLEARVIHVADAFEAMISDRPYRKAPGQDFAIEQLRAHSGTQFDPVVVDALLHVLGIPSVVSEHLSVA